MTVDEAIAKIRELRPRWLRQISGRSDIQKIVHEAGHLLLGDDAILAILTRAQADRAVVEKLSKTADGVPIVPGMKVAVITWNGKGPIFDMITSPTPKEFDGKHDSVGLWFDGNATWFAANVVYADRAKAEAALASTPVGGLQDNQRAVMGSDDMRGAPSQNWPSTPQPGQQDEGSS